MKGLVRSRTAAGGPRATARADPDQGLSREVKVVAAVVVLGVVMSILDTTIVNVALDTLSRDLQSPLSTIQRACCSPPSAELAERRPPSRTQMSDAVVTAVGQAVHSQPTGSAVSLSP